MQVTPLVIELPMCESVTFEQGDALLLALIQHAFLYHLRLHFTSSVTTGVVQSLFSFSNTWIYEIMTSCRDDWVDIMEFNLLLFHMCRL